MRDEEMMSSVYTLPEFEPSAGLWPRIEAARLRELSRRRNRRVGYLGAAIAATLAAVMLLPRPTIDRAASDPSWEREAQTLEQEWRGLDRAAPRDLAARAELRLIDQELQAAYDRGAGSDELAPLWQRRSETLRGLIATYRTDYAVTRI